MCGIFGYVGKQIDVGTQIYEALKTLEYRGYDSWGIAVGANGRIDLNKGPGKIHDAEISLPAGSIGFGHTRWATHGAVTAANAHPHLDCSGTVAVIHNGIIENFRALRTDLESKGHTFRSQTDSEVVAHLLEDVWNEPGSDRLAGFCKTFDSLEGLSAVIALDNASNTLFAAKKISPLVVGRGPNGLTIASDDYAMRDIADEVIYLDDGVVVSLGPDLLVLTDMDTGFAVEPVWQPIEFETRDLSLAGHPHFMSKEMAEQPDVLDRLAQDSNGSIEAFANAIRDSYGTFLVGCGTASYAALTGSYLFSRIASRHVNFVVGSEFKYHEHFLTPDSLVVALSQSGETADIIEAMLAARARGSQLAALINVTSSSLSRLVDLSVPLGAGPEQCVLSTKAYTAKVAVLLMAAHELAGTPLEGKRQVREAARALREMLRKEWVDTIRTIARTVFTANHMFVIGRGLSYPTALEAALKIKEVSYIHAEGFAGGELKHGVIALIEDETPCFVYAPLDETRRDILSGAMELKARGGYIIGVGPESDPCFDAYIPTPDVGDAAPIVQALPAQMLGYHVALLRGNDPDKPRNLAKSVTVK